MATSRQRREQPSANEEPPVQDLVVQAKKAEAESAPLDSDQWSPTQSPRPAPLPDKVLEAMDAAAKANASRRSSKRSAPADDLVPGPAGNAPLESDGWTPSRSRPKLDAKEEQTLAFLERLKPIVHPAKVNKDVNNPEEGVMPFNELEKFSGPQYGRHREFERRVVYKPNRHSPVQGYDFYVDEVNRKQETHTLYYYKIDPKSKQAKMIAVEKHDHVAFLSNYDIEADGKGKISNLH